jgi:hypothetical protein
MSIGICVCVSRVSLEGVCSYLSGENDTAISMTERDGTGPDRTT